MPVQNSYNKIIARAMKDETFRQQLLSNPKSVLERELGITIPQGVAVHVHEDTPTSINLTIPNVVRDNVAQELSDEELEMAAGGRNCVESGGGCGGSWLGCTGGIQG